MGYIRAAVRHPKPAVSRLFIIGCVLLAPFAPRASADAGPGLARFLPDKIAGWTPSGDDRVFTRETIARHAGGASSENLLAYGFRRLLAREYAGAAGARLTVEIHDMTTAADACGIFMNDPEGDGLNVGRAAAYRAGALRFWKGPYYVRLTAGKETAGTRGALEEIGLKIAAAIPEGGSKPRLLECLPPQGMEGRSARYFHRQVSLNAHYYLADENVLHLDGRTEAVLARYKEGRTSALLLVCRYRTPTDARRACLNFSRAYFSARFDPASDPAIEKIETGDFAGVRVTGACLIIVLESSARTSCGLLLRAAEARVLKAFPR